MPSDPELPDPEHPLRAARAPLEQAARGPMARGRVIPSTSRRCDRRRWAILDAAACVAALVGLVACGPDQEPELGTAAAPAATVSTPAPDTTDGPDTTDATGATVATTPPTGASPEPAFDPEQHVPDDPLGLVAEGWVLDERTVEDFAVDAEGSTCEGVRILAGLTGEPTVHEIYTDPDRPGLDLDITYVSAFAATGLASGFRALAECPAIVAAGTVTPVAKGPLESASGFRVGDEFALVAVGPAAPDLPLAIALEIESTGVTDELIDDLVRRSVVFLTGDLDPTLESRPITDDERAALDGDAAGLTCDAFGVGASEWDYGPIEGSEPTGRVAADAFRDALDEVRDGARREGGDLPPVDGWTELVVDTTSSVFVLVVDGVWQGRVNVSGDPDLGVWRHTSADFCQSLFVPDGVPLPTEPPATSGAPPRPQPPATTAP